MSKMATASLSGGKRQFFFINGDQLWSTWTKGNLQGQKIRVLNLILATSYLWLFSSGLSFASNEERNFITPFIHGKRVDYCYLWGDQCGKPAADAFCKAQHFQYATNFALQPEIGASNPTYIQGVGRVCSDPGCRGFRFIRCLRQVYSYGNDNVAEPSGQ
jgi:hypothetical protein